jgi:hypothetical protein
MKRLLLTAALSVIAMTGAANAVDLPKLLLLQGASGWCEEVVRSDATITVIRMTGRDGEECWNPKAQRSGFWLDGRGRFGWGDDSMCIPLHVSRERPVRDYEVEWTVAARCADHDTRKPQFLNQTWIFNLFKGSLNTITVR